MNSLTIGRAAITAMLLSVIAAVPAEATVDHTYVSGRGTDTGGCATPATACRTFAYAITQTAPAGEIIAIDAANYSPVTITQSISIVADGGGPAGIIVPAGNAITINAGTAGVVNFRGLTLDGEGTPSVGIRVNSAASLTIADCVARNFAGIGIVLIPSGPLKATILNTVITNSEDGLEAIGQLVTTTPTVTVRNVVVNNNSIGLFVTGATITFADSMVTGNQDGILINQPSNLFSYGDNEISGNSVVDINGGTLTPVAKK